MKKKRSADRHKGVIYGVHPVIETLRAGRREVREILVAREVRNDGELGPALSGDIPLIQLNRDDLTSVVGSPHHQGIAARVGPYPYVDENAFLEMLEGPVCTVVVLDGVQDPINLGNIIRSSECLGAAGVIVPRDRAVGVTPVAEKASAGAAAHLPVVQVVNLVRILKELKDVGFWVYAADADGTAPYSSFDMRDRIAFVLGSEGKGVRRLVGETCDATITIPMRGKISSLNVAQTAAILLAEALRRRGS